MEEKLLAGSGICKAYFRPSYVSIIYILLEGIQAFLLSYSASNLPVPIISYFGPWREALQALGVLPMNTTQRAWLALEPGLSDMLTIR